MSKSTGCRNEPSTSENDTMTMRMRFLFAALTLALAAGSCSREPRTELFNGRDLAGWVCVTDPEGVGDARDAFSVQNGNIRIAGSPFWYMRTEETYDDYRLHVEWRWIGEATNSGIFQRVQAGDRLWPEAVECQLQAGRAGDLLGLGGADVTCPALDPRLLVICGSVNAITLAQLDKAEQAGFTRLRLTPRQKLTPDYWYSEEGQTALKNIEGTLAAHPYNIIETNDEGGNELTAAAADALGLTREEMRVRIARGVGQLAGELFASHAVGTLLLTGGDTLLQCMNSVGVHELEPICEMERGVVLARFGCSGITRYVITKSGGFGHADLLTELAKQIATDTEETT